MSRIIIINRLIECGFFFFKLIIFFIVFSMHLCSSNHHTIKPLCVTGARVTCPASCCVTFVSTLNDGSIVGVGTNGLVYTRKTIDSPWVLSDGSMAMSSVTQLKDGTIIGTSQAGYFFRK